MTKAAHSVRQALAAIAFRAFLADEFIRRFLIHIPQRGFHRIWHYGLLAGSAHKDRLAGVRELLKAAEASDEPALEQAAPCMRPPCPCYGVAVVIIEAFARWCQPRGTPNAQPSSREIVHDPA